jgi:hypothetical protein
MRRLPLCQIALFVGILTSPALSQNLYSNGPINGQTDAWTINFGFVVSDSFTLNSDATPTGLEFGAWLIPGDVLENVEVSITSSEFGGTQYFDQVVSFTQQSNCPTNNYGYQVCVETGYFYQPPNLNAGTYWINLDNAVVNDGDPVFWDENSGPSSASQNAVGTVPSEAFTITGACCGTSPEPSSIILLGSGLLALAPLARLKLRG